MEVSYLILNISKKTSFSIKTSQAEFTYVNFYPEKKQTTEKWNGVSLQGAFCFDYLFIVHYIGNKYFLYNMLHDGTCTYMYTVY